LLHHDMLITGSDLVAKTLKLHGFEAFFFIMGGPMYGVENGCIAQGLRAIDVRHEQAGAMAAHAYARLLNRPGLCMAASGPGTTNLVTGLAHSLVDCVPVVALGGASPVGDSGRGVFQEFDQLTMMKSCTKWAERVYDAKRIPELLTTAIKQSMSGKRGPVYLDLPGDVLYSQVDEDSVRWPKPYQPQENFRGGASPSSVVQAVDLIRHASKPVLVAGSGVLWADGSKELQAFVAKTGIPFYTTPQSRGVVPEDDDSFFAAARSSAFKDADLIMVVGTRMNYVISHAAAPRFSADAKLIRIEVDPDELENSPRRPDVGLLGDAKVVLQQLLDGLGTDVNPRNIETWRSKLSAIDQKKSTEQDALLNSDETPIHPLRLCKEVRDLLERDDILVVDGQEILNFGRQSIPTHTAGHRLNSGTFGTMGVGMPFGIGAKVAKPNHKVVVLHGDGSFGLNAMEFDTAVRHKLPVLVVISLNGGWTADPKKEKPGRDLGYTRFDQVAVALGGHGEYVESPQELRSALRRALEAVTSGTPALVNVVTDWRARAGAAAFTAYST
jgi:acetolactate synthase-1/2/3 large subunit